MKQLKNLIDIGNLLASHPIYTYDYTDGLYINPYNRGIQDEEQDEDMVNTYDELYKALVKWEEDHLTPDLIKSLYISKLFQSLKH